MASMDTLIANEERESEVVLQSQLRNQVHWTNQYRMLSYAIRGLLPDFRSPTRFLVSYAIFGI